MPCAVDGHLVHVVVFRERHLRHILLSLPDAIVADGQHTQEGAI
jgi:hypothetical protein